MNDTKVYLVLQSLTNRERGKFLKYIQSPYFNKNQPLVDLFNIIQKNLQSKKEKEIDKAKVWVQIQPNQSYDDVRFRKYLSDLQKHVENFLALQVYENNHFYQNNFLLQAIVDRKLEKLYSSAKKATKEQKEKSIIRNADYHLFNYQALKLLHDIETDGEQKKKISTEFSELSNNLDDYYFSEKLRLSYDAEVWNRLDGQLDAKIEHVDVIMQLINHNNNKSPAVSVYHSMYLLNKYPEQNEYYFLFKEQLEKNIKYFVSHEAIPIYTAGINHCIRKINTGDPSFLEELFLLYNGYVQSVIDDTGQLSQWTFNNVIGVGIRLEKFEWVKKFIEEYGDYINPKHKDNAVIYNTAFYLFAQKRYEEVLKVLRNIEYDDIYYSLNSKTILLMTYYELQDFDPLSFFLDSFRAFLNRNKLIPDSKKMLFKTLISLTKKLININPNDQKAIIKLKGTLSKEKKLSTTTRKWLLEKIAELE